MFTVAHLYDVNPDEVQIRDYDAYGNDRMAQLIIGDGDGSAVVHFTGDDVIGQIENLGLKLVAYATAMRRQRVERETADAKTEALKDARETEQLLREAEEGPDVEPF